MKISERSLGSAKDRPGSGAEIASGSCEHVLDTIDSVDGQWRSGGPRLCTWRECGVVDAAEIDDVVECAEESENEAEDLEPRGVDEHAHETARRGSASREKQSCVEDEYMTAYQNKRSVAEYGCCQKRARTSF